MPATFAVALLLAASPVSGTFGSKDVSVKIVDGYAYPSKAEFGDDEVIAVRLSSVPLDHAALDATLDREGLLDTQAADSPHIKLEFDRAGELRGASYYLASGNGCGYCSTPDAPGIAVKLVGNALRGTLKIRSSDHSDGSGAVADLALDLPVAPAVKAAALGADGGDPGKVFLACQAAVAKKDVAAFRRDCAILEEELSYGEQNGSLDGFWEYGVSGHPALLLRNVKFTGGRATASEAELLLNATDKDGAKHKAIVRLVKTDAGWRYRKADVEAVYE